MRRSDQASGAAQHDREASVSSREILEVRTWLRLLTCTQLIEGRVRSNLRNRFEITLPRFDVLAQLHRSPEGLTMGELSRHLMVSNGNVTGLVGRLVDEGLVERRTDPDDRRSQRVQLTPTGESTLLEMIPVHHDWVHEMFGGLSRSETRSLLGLLAKLKASVVESVPEGHAGRKR